jgi:hypothetical protein
MDALDHEPEGSAGAEQAFAALREEVAALRRGIELVYRQQQQGAPGPDYSPTLGRMEQALQAIAGRLAAIETAPSLAMTPANLRVEIEAVAQGAASVVSQPFVTAVREARDTARELEALAGRVRERREQRQWLATVGATGIMGGVLLWFMLIALLPWGAGNWLAALPLGGGPWQAGETLMQEAAPASFEKMARLYKACGAQPVALCEAAITVWTISGGHGKARRTP